MKTKKTLFNISGILKCVVGVGVVLFFVLMLALGGLLKEVMLKDPEGLQASVQELASTDANYKFLLDMTNEQVVDYFMKTINIFAGVMIVLGLVTIVLAVFNFIFAKNYYGLIANRLGLKIFFAIIQFVLYWGLISNILSTIALFMRVDDENYQQNKMEKLGNE